MDGQKKDQVAAGTGKTKMGVSMGPWGGQGGIPWDDGADYNGVREIKLAYGQCIDSITVVYDKNNRPVVGAKHGGTGGSQISEIKLQYPSEILTSVSGYYSPVVYGGQPVIRSLTLKSNKRTYGPFGVEEGTPFSFSTDGGLIVVGFKGRCDWYLDAIEFRLSRFQPAPLYQKVHKKLKNLVSIKSKASSQKESKQS